MNTIRNQRAEYKGPVHFLAQFFSIVFHPVTIPTYVAAFLMFVHPAAFMGYDSGVKVYRFLTVFVCTFFLPVFSIFIAWRLKLIPSLYLRNTRDRFIPYLLVMFFYWWVFYVFKNQEIPRVFQQFLLGAFLAVIGGWLCNIFFKISMHGIAMGGLLMFALLFAFHDSYTSGYYISIAFLVAGLVCTSRFIISDHTSREIYSGLVIGILSQLIAWYFPF